MIKELTELRKHIQERGLGLTIRELRKLCLDHHLRAMLMKIEAIDNDYSLMKRFMHDGFEDKNRVDFYKKLQVRVYNVTSEMMILCEANRNPAFKQSVNNANRIGIELAEVENILSRYDQDFALLTLTEDNNDKKRELHQQLLQYRIALFDTLYTSSPLSGQDAEILTKILLSDNIDEVDLQIMLSALLLAQRCVFDGRKFQVLCRVCMETPNVNVRVRALVAIALALPNEVEHEIYKDLIDDIFPLFFIRPDIQKEWFELQRQMYYCLATKQNEKTIQDDIMPSLMNSRMNWSHIQPTEEDKLDELLHPDKEEKDMEKIEAAVERMRSMQKEGADIFFAGFSQAKRMAFFYTLMNWFCPFYLDHPQVVRMLSPNIPEAFLMKIVEGQYFCNSDKYSFVLSLASVIGQVPADMLEMMKRGEVAPAFEDKLSNSTTFILRSYLNDLYRFYNLYTDKDSFRNPFADEISACILLNPLVVAHNSNQKQTYSVGRLLLKKKHHRALELLLSAYEDTSNLDYLKLHALNSETNRSSLVARLTYEKIHELDPSAIIVYKRLGNVLFRHDELQDALALYEKYLELAPKDEDNRDVEFNMAIAMIKLCREKDALNILFRLAYDDSQNQKYQKTIAWAYLRDKQYESAVKIYMSLPETDLSGSELIRKGVALWQTNRIPEAVDCMKLYLKDSADNTPPIIDAIIETMHSEDMDSGKQHEAMILADMALDALHNENQDE